MKDGEEDYRRTVNVNGGFASGKIPSELKEFLDELDVDYDMSRMVSNGEKIYYLSLIHISFWFQQQLWRLELMSRMQQLWLWKMQTDSGLPGCISYAVELEEAMRSHIVFLSAIQEMP